MVVSGGSIMSLKIGNTPFNLCIILICLFYLLAYLCEMKAVSHLKLFYSISFHICILFIELMVIFIEYIKIFMNDLKINNQKARILILNLENL